MVAGALGATGAVVVRVVVVETSSDRESAPTPPRKIMESRVLDGARTAKHAIQTRVLLVR